MSKRTRQVSDYECDRCGFEIDGDVIREDEARNCGPSSREFFVAAAVPERNRNQLADPKVPLVWLCPDCIRAYSLFMQGKKTPAGIRFNSWEAVRRRYAESGELHEQHEFLRTTAHSDLA